MRLKLWDLANMILGFGLGMITISIPYAGIVWFLSYIHVFTTIPALMAFGFCAMCSFFAVSAGQGKMGFWKAKDWLSPNPQEVIVET